MAKTSTKSVSKKATKRPVTARSTQAPKASALVKVRRSKIHGSGVFALKPIRKGTRIIEYIGDRVSHKEADRRYEDKAEDDNHTFLFIVDNRTVIDAGVGGNEARFINHACEPNCETVVEDRRVFIEAVRAIKTGQELNYDYQIKRDRSDPKNVDEVYACRCGAATCRGSMLEPKKPAKKKKRASARRRSR